MLPLDVTPDTQALLDQLVAMQEQQTVMLTALLVFGVFLVVLLGLVAVKAVW